MLRAFLVGIAVVASLGDFSFAADRFWIDTGGGSFTDTGKWSITSAGGGGASVPVAGDSAIFDQAGNYTVTLSSNHALDVLDVEAGTITFDSTGGAQTYDLLTGGADALFVGSDVTINGTNLNIGDDFSVADGSMLVQGGSDVTVGDTASIATGTGNAMVTFNASSFDFGGRLRLALSGLDGTLNLQNGSTGNIDGDLEFVRSGTLGSGGFLNVSSASTLTTGGAVLVGDILSNGSPSYNAFLTLENANSVLTMNGANNLRVGDSQFDNVNAELRVRNGGTFETGIGGGNSIVQRTGLIAVESGGTFTARNDLLVNQTGEVTVTGGTLNTDAQFVIDATSSVTLDGGAINANAGLDNSAGGTLSLRNGLLTVTGGVFSPNAGVADVDDFTIDGNFPIESPRLTIGAGASTSIGRALIVGGTNRGELTVNGGGTVSVDNGAGLVGSGADSTGTMTVTGANSTWSATQQLIIGGAGNGTLTIGDGGQVSNGLGGVVGSVGDSAGDVMVTGSGSTWINTSTLTVAMSGDGTLTIADSGQVSNTNGAIGDGGGSTGMVTVTGGGSTWTNDGELEIGDSGEGVLIIADGGVVSSTTAVLADSSNSIGTLTVSDNGSTWTNSDLLTIGRIGQGTLTISLGGQVSSVGGIIGATSPSTGTATITGAGSSWTNTGLLRIGNLGQGVLTIESNGHASTDSVVIGTDTGSSGQVTVDDATWDIDGSLSVGGIGDGVLDVINGGVVTSGSGSINDEGPSATSSALVSGQGSRWEMTGDLDVGDDGSGALTLQDQGVVQVGGNLEIFATGTITLDGGSLVTQSMDHANGGVFNFIAGSLTVNNGLNIGNDPSGVFPGSFTLNSDRQLITLGLTTIAPFRTLTIDGGQLRTGDLDIQGTLDFIRGTLAFIGAGGLTVGAAGPFGSSLSVESGQTLEVSNVLTVDNGAALDLEGGDLQAGTIQVSGVLRGDGIINGLLSITNIGELQVLPGDHLFHEGIFNATSSGQITLAGGQVHFANQFNILGSGLVIGNGTLRADLLINNSGDMAFSATTNVIGDVTNNASGTIITAGGTTTFFDDVTNNGEIRTNENSFAVYFGSYSGNGDTGTGTVVMEGDLKPGSSPGEMSFGGNLSFGPAAGLEIELGGLLAGDEFDVVSIAEDVSLGGTLDVSLINGFAPTAGDMFEIITASSVLDMFDAENLPALTDLEWNINYGADNVVLEVLASITTDTEPDGDVDGADFLFLQRNNPALIPQWELEYSSAQLAAASASVPEPKSILMLAVSLAMVWLRH